MPTQQRPLDETHERADSLQQHFVPTPQWTQGPAGPVETRRAEPVGPVNPAGPVGSDPAGAASVLKHWTETPSPVQGPPAVAPAQAPAAAAQGPAVQGPAAAPGAVAAPGAAPAEAEPAHLDRHAVNRALGVGSKGDQVVALQQFLGLSEKDADGKFGPGTAKKVKEWQAAHGLAQSGRLDERTIAAMRGDQHMFGYSYNHDPDKFVPKYAMTAYHESNDMRTAADPYATGCITHPDAETDPGGKTYGTYQFESYTYPGGTNAGKDQVAGSTVSRFAGWKGNPYGAQLQAVIAKHGVGSAEFDAVWQKMSAEHNREFGMAQEAFLEFDQGAKVKAMFDKVGASEEARKDPRLFDLMLGTANQLGGLADRVAGDVARQQDKSGKKFNADELGRAVIDDKLQNVDRFFASSKQDTRDGVRARYNDERTVFPEHKPENKPEPNKQSS